MSTGVSYLSVQFGQLLLIQIGLLVHPGLVSKLSVGQKKKRDKGNEELFLAQSVSAPNSLSFWPRSTKWGPADLLYGEALSCLLHISPFLLH